MKRRDKIADRLPRILRPVWFALSAAVAAVVILIAVLVLGLAMYWRCLVVGIDELRIYMSERT